MGRVRNLKILKGVVYAEVGVGELDNGGYVTMNVKVARGEEAAVQQALRQLDAALVAIAERYQGETTTNAVVEGRLEARLATVRKRHEESLRVQRQALIKDAANKVRQRISRHREATAVDMEIRRVLDAAVVDIESIDRERRTA